MLLGLLVNHSNMVQSLFFKREANTINCYIANCTEIIYKKNYCSSSLISFNKGAREGSKSIITSIFDCFADPTPANTKGVMKFSIFDQVMVLRPDAPNSASSIPH